MIPDNFADRLNKLEMLDYATLSRLKEAHRNAVEQGDEYLLREGRHTELYHAVNRVIKYVYLSPELKSRNVYSQFDYIVARLSEVNGVCEHTPLDSYEYFLMKWYVATQMRILIGMLI